MRHRKKTGRSHFPLRYLPILAVAVGIAESVHAPSIQRSNASPSKSEPPTPTKNHSNLLPGKDSKKSGTMNVGPASSEGEDTSLEDLGLVMEPFMPTPSRLSSPQSNLLQALPDEPSSFGSESSTPSVGGDAPSLSAMAGSNQLASEEDRSSGSTASNGVVNNGPVNRGLVHNALTATGVASVPEPGSAMIIAIGAMGLLRRRR